MEKEERKMIENTFNIGDSVQCIKPASILNLVKDGIYTVTSLDPQGLGFIRVNNRERYVNEDRFMLADPTQLANDVLNIMTDQQQKAFKLGMLMLKKHEVEKDMTAYFEEKEALQEKLEDKFVSIQAQQKNINTEIKKMMGEE